MFNSALTKLTIIYVLIVMIISISFSVVLYNVSNNELGQGLGKQTRAIREMPNNDPFVQHLEDMRDAQIEESATNLRNNLIYFNLIILISSLFASYFLAKITLRPIEESMEAQNRFTADASHELRTPLTAMKTENEVTLRDRNLTLSDAKSQLQSNIEEVNKLEYLSSALLKLAKMDNNDKSNFSPVNLARVCESAINKVNKLADKKKITINAKLKQIDINGDEQSLIELIIILLDNAIKYSPDNSKITLEIRKGERHPEIIVSDQGIGIKASDLPHLFERFYRADSSRSKEKVDGYGLGLSIAMRIANIHGAEILVSSKLGKGSIFRIKF